jgi:hypothetical protein
MTKGCTVNALVNVAQMVPRSDTQADTVLCASLTFVGNSRPATYISDDHLSKRGISVVLRLDLFTSILTRI